MLKRLTLALFLMAALSMALPVSARADIIPRPIDSITYDNTALIIIIIVAMVVIAAVILALVFRKLRKK